MGNMDWGVLGFLLVGSLPGIWLGSHLTGRISDEVLLRYNGMLASVFELLADSREQMSSVNAAIEAQRDFWLAENRLQSTINGGGTAGKN